MALTSTPRHAAYCKSFPVLYGGEGSFGEKGTS
jgi:hypothetical protein